MAGNRCGLEDVGFSIWTLACHNVLVVTFCPYGRLGKGAPSGGKKRRNIETADSLQSHKMKLSWAPIVTAENDVECLIPADARSNDDPSYSLLSRRSAESEGRRGRRKRKDFSRTAVLSILLPPPPLPPTRHHPRI